MSLETSAIKLCYSVGKGLDSAAPQRIKSTVNKHALWGGLVMGLPFFGFEAIAYCMILWNMYSSVAKAAGLKFSGAVVRNVLGGFIINIICVFVLNIFMDWILFLGWIGMFFAAFVATRYSGIAYLGILEAFHGKNKMKETLSYDKGKQAFLEAGGKKNTTGVAKSAIISEILD